MSRSSWPCAGWRCELRHTDIQILHTGYLDPALRQGKRERDLRLLFLEYPEWQDQEAEQQWRLAVADNPAYLPSWLALRELFQVQQRGAEVDWVTQQLEKPAR
jgi:hypothetical protein